MSKSKKVNLIINIILTCFYIPLSFFGFFMLMGMESLMEETNQMIIVWTNIFSYVGFFMFAICGSSMVLGNFLYKKNHIAVSIVVRFIPLILVAIALIIDTIVRAIV